LSCSSCSAPQAALLTCWPRDKFKRHRHRCARAQAFSHFSLAARPPSQYWSNDRRGSGSETGTADPPVIGVAASGVATGPGAAITVGAIRASRSACACQKVARSLQLFHHWHEALRSSFLRRRGAAPCHPILINSAILSAVGVFARARGQCCGDGLWAEARGAQRGGPAGHQRAAGGLADGTRFVVNNRSGEMLAIYYPLAEPSADMSSDREIRLLPQGPSPASG
jgi:hypothetical protein